MAEVASMRQAYGETLVALGRTNPEVVVVNSDVSNSDYSYMFAEAFPDRCFDVGISEQALVDVAAGLANVGYIPVANTFAFLFATRALEMVRTHLCYGRANVKLMASFAGFSPAFDGPTHHCITDLAIMRALPRMTVVVPADSLALTKLMPMVIEHEGPVYFRVNRNDMPVIYGDDFAPVLGTAHTARNGSDATVVACGIMVSKALAAAAVLEEKGISTRVLDIHTVKPFDRAAVLQAAQETGAVVTAEEHSIIGGLGSAVAEVVAEERSAVLRRVGVQDQFAETGPYEEILQGYGLTEEAIVDAVSEAVQSKRAR